MLVLQLQSLCFGSAGNDSGKKGSVCVPARSLMSIVLSVSLVEVQHLYSSSLSLVVSESAAITSVWALNHANKGFQCFKVRCELMKKSEAVGVSQLVKQRVSCS
jgi:hypothetical protein